MMLKFEGTVEANNKAASFVIDIRPQGEFVFVYVNVGGRTSSCLMPVTRASDYFEWAYKQAAMLATWLP